MMGETMIKLMFDYDGIELPHEDKAVNRINKLRREDLLDADTAMLFHSLRKIRNQAGHEGYESVRDARNYLGITYSLSEWFMQTYGDYDFIPKPYVEPEKASVKEERLAKENRELEEKYKSLEKEIERYLAKSLSFKSKWKSVNSAGPNDVCVRSNSHIRSLNILMIFLSIVHSDNNLRSCSENVTGSRE
jgi:type I restriction enzyme R subunit